MKSHCKRGHALTPDNTRKAKSGTIICKTCQSENQMKYREGRMRSGRSMRPSKSARDAQKERILARHPVYAEAEDDVAAEEQMESEFFDRKS